MFSDLREGWLGMEGTGLVGTDASFDGLIYVPLIDEIFLTKRTFVLKHNCYYTNTKSKASHTIAGKLNSYY